MIKRGETVFIAVLIVFSTAALWESYGIAGFDKWSSPGVFPMLASATMLMCALFILRDCRTHISKHQHQSFVDSKPASNSVTTDVPHEQSSTNIDTIDSSSVLPTRVVVMTLLMVTYVVVMPALGFLLDSGLFLFASISYLWKKPVWFALLVSLTSLLVIHIVFRVVFQVILPQGSLIELIL